MEKHNILISVASWEERFRLGFERVLDEHKPQRVILFAYKEYLAETAANRRSLLVECERRKTLVDERNLSFADPLTSWRDIFLSIDTMVPPESHVLVDISTMPRETAWTILDLVQNKKCSVKYIYHRPKSYNNEWLSRDPGRPRLVYKMAGITKLGMGTTLLVTTGWDADRVRQLMAFFEPERTLLGLQKGEQHQNQPRSQPYRDLLHDNQRSVQIFEIDAFSADHGLAEVENQLKDKIANTNVIMSSLGPKLSAIALYRYHQKHPEVALAYAPSNEFNPDYSHGIADTLIFDL